MKGRLLNLCVLLVAVAVCGACHGKPSPKAGVAKPGASPSPPAVTKVSAPAVTQPSDAVTPPSAATPTAPPSPATTAPAPAAAGAGPAASVAPTPPMSSTGVAVDGSNVYVLKDGKLYKFAKCDVSECGTAVPPVPCPPCPTGAGPCSPCSSMSYIPGALSTPVATTCTPCPTPGCPATSSTIVSCPSCAPAPCPTTSCDPCSTPPTTNCSPCPTPCPTTRCITYPVTSTSAGMGSGPAACPPVAGVSANTQAMVTCLQDLCGADADKAYLQAIIQLQLCVLALSDSSAQQLSTTTLQNYATNSIADSRSSVAQAREWLKTKYCLDVLTCAPSLAPGLNICSIDHPGREFDDAYKNQLVQYYVDEIALSQVELQRGLDCQVMAAAAKTIKDNQVRISRLMRCNVCI